MSGDLPLKNGSGWLYGTLNAGAMLYVRFQVTLDAGAYDGITNCDNVYSDAGSFGHCVTSPVASYDWGDLPDTYGTTAAADGPHHSNSGLFLGTLWDAETQGQPNATATGDDTAGLDDEDGAGNVGTGNDWMSGTGKFQVAVTGGPGCLNAWMDFTNDAGQRPVAPSYLKYSDGNFTKSGGGYDSVTIGATTYSEHIINNVTVSNGTQVLTVAVPPDLNRIPGTQYYVRFRLSPSPCGTITPHGYVAGGEVEDYRFTLDAPTLARVTALATAGDMREVTLSWQTTEETSNLGFNVYRAKTLESKRSLINSALIPSLVHPGSMVGARYEFVDAPPPGALAYYYWIESVDIYGNTEMHGPVVIGAK